jgi:hypothetical protein
VVLTQLDAARDALEASLAARAGTLSEHRRSGRMMA